MPDDRQIPPSANPDLQVVILSTYMQCDSVAQLSGNFAALRINCDCVKGHNGSHVANIGPLYVNWA